MQRSNVKPSKPAAVLGLVIGIGILVFGLTSMHRFTPFLVFWAIALVAIVAFNVWSAFSSRGSAYTVQAQPDETPRRRGPAT